MKVNYFLTFVMLLTFTSCTPFNIDHGDVEGPIRQVSLDLPVRKLSPGDRLNVVYIMDVSANATSKYVLDNLDEVIVTVREREDLSGVFRIVPDGWLFVPMLEPINVRGMTIFKLKEELVKRYSKQIDAPQVHVGLKSYNQNAQSFINSLAQASNLGPVYQCLIERDGYSSLPLVGNLKLQGLTTTEATELLVSKYKVAVPGLQLIVSVQPNPYDLVTVLGEVNSPGAFPIVTDISLAEALGLAKGWTNQATISHVLLIQQRNEEVNVEVFDMQKDILLSTQINLMAGDMIYVPRSVPADINTLVDQLIRRNIPINANVTRTVD